MHLQSGYIKKIKDVLWRKETAWLWVFLTATGLSIFPVFMLSFVDFSGIEPVATASFAAYPRLNNMLLWAHVFFAVPALLLGPWLFWARFRGMFPALHRNLGKIYVIACLLSAASSLPLGLGNSVGIVPRVGFSMLAVCWFFFTYTAYLCARRKDFVSHRRWMMRSYACTYAFVNVKIYALSMLFFGFETELWLLQTLQSCVSWTTNLLIVEVYLAATLFTGVYAGKKNFLKNLRYLPARAAILLAFFTSAALLTATFFPLPQ